MNDWFLKRTPKVLNKKTDDIPVDAKYIGRPGKFGNKYVIGKDGSREEVIQKFRADFDKDEQLQKAVVAELMGHDLVCFCAPLACHGDVYIEFLYGETDEA